MAVQSDLLIKDFGMNVTDESTTMPIQKRTDDVKVFASMYKTQNVVYLTEIINSHFNDRGVSEGEFATQDTGIRIELNDNDSLFKFVKNHGVGGEPVSTDVLAFSIEPYVGFVDNESKLTSLYKYISPDSIENATEAEFKRIVNIHQHSENILFLFFHDLTVTHLQQGSRTISDVEQSALYRYFMRNDRLSHLVNYLAPNSSRDLAIVTSKMLNQFNKLVYNRETKLYNGDDLWTASDLGRNVKFISVDIIGNQKCPGVTFTRIKPCDSDFSTIDSEALLDIKDIVFTGDVSDITGNFVCFEKHNPGVYHRAISIDEYIDTLVKCGLRFENDIAMEQAFIKRVLKIIECDNDILGVQLGTGEWLIIDATTSDDYDRIKADFRNARDESDNDGMYLVIQSIDTATRVPRLARRVEKEAGEVAYIAFRLSATVALTVIKFTKTSNSNPSEPSRKEPTRFHIADKVMTPELFSGPIDVLIAQQSGEFDIFQDYSQSITYNFNGEAIPVLDANAILKLGGLCDNEDPTHPDNKPYMHGDSMVFSTYYQIEALHLIDKELAVLIINDHSKTRKALVNVSKDILGNIIRLTPYIGNTLGVNILDLGYKIALRYKRVLLMTSLVNQNEFDVIIQKPIVLPNGEIVDQNKSLILFLSDNKLR